MPTFFRCRRLRAGTASASLAALALGGGWLSTPAAAHPHVWVSVEATVLFDNGAITGIEQRWTFDEFYSAQAGEGLDKNRDGKLDSSELAELAQVNMEGLKEFDYFTEVRLAGRILDFEAPKNVVLEQVSVKEPPGPGVGGPLPNDQPQQGGWWSNLLGAGKQAAPVDAKVLALSFTLPFKQQVLADAEGFQFTIDDSSYFIWLELAKKDGVRLSANAPKDCKAMVGGADMSGDQKKLSEAFGSTGMVPQNQDALKTVRMQCPKG